MSSFSPKCPICGKDDDLIIYRKNGKICLDKYYCSECKHIFSADEGYSPYVLSSYSVTGDSVDVFSGSNRFTVSEE